MRVQNLLRESQLAGGAEDAAHFFKAREEFRVGWGSRGDVDVAGRREVVGCSEGTARGGKGGEREAWLLLKLVSCCDCCGVDEV